MGGEVSPERIGGPVVFDLGAVRILAFFSFRRSVGTPGWRPTGQVPSWVDIRRVLWVTSPRVRGDTDAGHCRTPRVKRGDVRHGCGRLLDG